MAYRPLRAYVAFVGALAMALGAARFSIVLLALGLALIAFAAWDGRQGVRVALNVGSVLLAVAATVALFAGCVILSLSEAGERLATALLAGLVGAPIALIGLLLQWVGRPREDREDLLRPSLPRWL